MIISLLIAFALSGCDGGGNINTHNGVLIAPGETISMYSLAGRLDMVVTDRSAKMVSMRDDHNTVVIFADPGGQAYVNGEPLGQPIGGVVRSDGVLFVPVGFEPAIRSALRRPTAEQPPFQPTVPEPVPAAPPTRPRVVIDPGHGGRDPGATSRHGHYEKAIVLDVARTASARLALSGA